MYLSDLVSDLPIRAHLPKSRFYSTYPQPSRPLPHELWRGQKVPPTTCGLGGFCNWMKNLPDFLILDQSNPMKRPPDRVWSTFEAHLGYPILHHMTVSEDLEAHFSGFQS